jgi:hypothetical protein
MPKRTTRKDIRPTRRNSVRNCLEKEWKLAGNQGVFFRRRRSQARGNAEDGHGAQMIFKHYRELVRPKEAEAWLGIVPAPGEVAGAAHGAKPANVVELKRAA